MAYNVPNWNCAVQGRPRYGDGSRIIRTEYTIVLKFRNKHEVLNLQKSETYVHYDLHHTGSWAWCRVGEGDTGG